MWACRCDEGKFVRDKDVWVCEEYEGVSGVERLPGMRCGRTNVSIYGRKVVNTTTTTTTTTNTNTNNNNNKYNIITTS
ncbi:hypothetical protein E2C01_084083 [Portunus trituberculatus]|uniref:Uncharacterized protein n=1 Tax=Portunus trituberculatus TaxID=210409 RepID=A0A5B7J3B6_PORTR|nr:hypothetical protein [Portunus trituberculatus]